MLNLPARSVAKALAVFVVLALIVDLLMQKTSDPQTGMWACYWASGVIVVGVMAGWDQPVAWGVIFFEGVGLPSWLLGVLLGKPVYVTSVLIHIIPLVAGLLYMRRFNELPRFSVLGAWLLSVVPFAVAWYVCDPSRMIDLTHLNRSMLPFILPQVWQFYTALAVVTATSTVLAGWLLDPLLRYRKSAYREAIESGAIEEMKRSDM